ncbi:MAG: glycosyltransferase [Bryobacterales bacterium]|nr:glycosyltransferase [Bryobacteraceae bacterium]MDW8353514.1 glycosyltransferase [Bryobacterales bacterium]
MSWFWALYLPALLLALAGLRGERRRARFYRESLASVGAATWLPPVTLIVPVKGPEEGLRENLASLAGQDYPDYELIVAARKAEDIPEGVVPDGARVVLAGETPCDTGEKIQNLLAGVEAARPHSEVLAFADSDGRVSSAWLRALVAPLEDPSVGATTGYRWYLPEPPDFWSLLRSVWNAVIAGRLGPEQTDFAWGGAMAIRRDVFHRCRVPEFWRGAVSDDYRLSEAVRSAGLSIRFAPGALAVSPDRTTAREFWSWTRRQLVITRVYCPRLWWYAFISHAIYCTATVACLICAFSGGLLGEYGLVALWGIGMAKGAHRAALAREALPAWDGWFRRHSWVHAWWTPLATWAWMASLVASAFSRTIEWRGRTYRLVRPATP